MFTEIFGPGTTGYYNVHNVMTGSNNYLGLFCQAGSLPKPKSLDWRRLYCYAKNSFQTLNLDNVYVQGQVCACFIHFL